jgi:hypothetical protein
LLTWFVVRKFDNGLQNSRGYDMSQKPTARQLAWLARHGIEPVATRSVCSAIIGYVINCNGLGNAKTFSHRLALLKEMQRKYEGKPARWGHSGGGYSEEIYTICRVYPKSLEKIRFKAESARLTRLSGGDEEPYTCPFNATYLKEGARRRNHVSLGCLVLCEEIEEKVGVG